jgi:hypothetical protein
MEKQEVTADGAPVDWSGKRAWFDELVSIGDARSFEAGWSFTEARNTEVARTKKPRRRNETRSSQAVTVLFVG